MTLTDEEKNAAAETLVPKVKDAATQAASTYKFADPEELESIAYCSLAEALNKYDGPPHEASIQSWCLAIVRQDCIDHIRKEGRRK